MFARYAQAIVVGTMIGLSAGAIGLYAHAQHAHGAHVHGEAQAAIVIDGESLSISLNSAMYNITGFERAPQNPEEEAVLADAISSLKAGDALFVMDTAAGCTLSSMTHSLPEGATPVESGHNPYRDLEATYEFACAAPDALVSVSVDLFDRFEKLEKLDTVVLRGDAQIAISLSADQNRIELVG